MAAFWTSFFSDQASKIIDSIGKIIDNLVTTEKERVELKKQIKQDTEKHCEEMAKQIVTLESEVTQRHKTDMASDSWLAKNIRPLCLIYILGLFTLLSLGPFEPTKPVMETIGGFAIIVMSFYFGGRSFEKIAAIMKKQ